MPTAKRTKPRQRLNERQRAIVRRAASVGLKQAVRDVVPGVSYVRHAHIVDQVARKMREVLDECGLEDKLLIQRYLKPALRAKETKFFPMPSDLDPTNIETRDVVAWGTRLRALDMAFLLKGSYAPRNVRVEAELSLADEVRMARARAVQADARTDAEPGTGGF